MSLVKAIVLGVVLTWIVSIVLGSNHSTGGYLSIHLMHVAGYDIHWSWPLFFIATGLAWAILTMMPSNR
jgi:hypothetical protein